MILFLDTSVLLAASGSAEGASRFLLEHSKKYKWKLFSSDYCVIETERNLKKLGKDAVQSWLQNVLPNLKLCNAAFSYDKALVFPKTKDRPVIISALAVKADVILTLDRNDFHAVLGKQVYGMKVQTPAEFLISQRKDGLI